MKDVSLTYYKDVVSKNIKWLWYPYIPLGKITIVQGDPGEGKTTFFEISILTYSWRIPKSIKLSLPLKDPMSQSEISPEIEIDLGDNSNRNFGRFIEIIDEAEVSLLKATRTDIPYFI